MSPLSSMLPLSAFPPLRKLRYIPPFHPYPELNQRIKLTNIPQVLISIVNSFLPFKDHFVLRSVSKYFNVSRHIDVLDLLEKPIPYKIFSQNLFKFYLSIRELNIAFDGHDAFSFLKNPKFASVSKLHLKYLTGYETNLSGKPSYEYLSTFTFSLTDLTLSSNSFFDLNCILPLVNLQKLTILGCGFNTCKPLFNLTKLTELRINNSSISDISSLARLTNLTLLDLKNNDSLIWIDTLRNFTQLKHLNLANCKYINNIEPLATLCNLEYLNLTHISTAVSPKEIDPTFLTHMPKLQKLNLFFENDCPHLTYLAHLTDLTCLSLKITTAVDFSPLLGLTQLLRLICENLEGNSFQDYEPIFLISSLTELHLVGKMDRLPQIIQLPHLKILSLQDNKNLTDISSLRTIRELETLDLSHTSIENLEPISQLFKLRHLNLFPFCKNMQQLARLRNLTLLSGADFDPSTLLKLRRLQYLSINLTNYRINGPDLEPLYEMQALKSLCLYDYIGGKIIPLSNFYLNQKLKSLLDKDVFSVDNDIKENFFSILKSIGQYPKF